MDLQSGDPADYLSADDVIQSDAPHVIETATAIRAQHPDDVSFVQAAFEWVRDHIAHSVDAQDPPRDAHCHCGPDSECGIVLRQIAPAGSATPQPGHTRRSGPTHPTWAFGDRGTYAR